MYNGRHKKPKPLPLDTDIWEYQANIFRESLANYIREFIDSWHCSRLPTSVETLSAGSSLDIILFFE